MRIRRKERGVAVVVLVGALLLLGAYFVTANWNFAAVRVARDRVTTEALLRAKEALVAYAATDANRPGELPCPDVNDDGQLTLGVDFGGGGACTSLVGRLPYRTLDLPDLRDDSGERLWYAVSADFRAGNTIALNNNTAFRASNASLSVTGQQAASNVVAVLLAPGAPLRRQGSAALQTRSGAAALVPANYLDLDAATGVDNADANVSFVAAAKSETFNDGVLPIHSDDIMWLVERRAGREFAARLREHYDAWKSVTGEGFYPWAAPFTDPANMQSGENGRHEGLLPLDPAPVVWTSASITGGACGGIGTTEIVCTALVLLGLGGDVTGRVGNIGTAFVDPPDGSEVTTGGLLLLGAPTSTWTVNRTLQALQVSTNVSFLGTGIVTVRVRAPRSSAWISSPTWVVTNRWYEVAYYSVAPAFAITGASAGGVQSCGTCITVSNTISPANKEAVITMTGRALDGQPQRPVPPPPPLALMDLNFYLENGNQTAGDRNFESNARTASFNDAPIVVRP